jgi:flagellar biosynthesis protein
VPERPPERRAAALRYAEGAPAPKVLAVGRGELAERIVEAARAAGVPVSEQPALAEALSRLGLGAEIPPELYLAVAETLVWAYRVDAAATPPR